MISFWEFNLSLNGSGDGKSSINEHGNYKK